MVRAGGRSQRLLEAYWPLQRGQLERPLSEDRSVRGGDAQRESHLVIISLARVHIAPHASFLCADLHFGACSGINSGLRFGGRSRAVAILARYENDEGIN